MTFIHNQTLDSSMLPGVIRESEAILLVGRESDHSFVTETKQTFPQAQIEHMTMACFLETGETSIEASSHKRYRYILLEPEESKIYGFRLLDKTSSLLSLLTEDGFMQLTLYGYSGYYGISMVASIVDSLIRDIEDLENSKEFNKVKGVVKAVIEGLPKNHPAFTQKQFIHQLEQGHHQSIKILLSILPENVFTVSRVMDNLREKKVCFKGWGNPQHYRVEPQFDEDILDNRFSQLLPPRSWEAAEMINAAPPEHTFFICYCPS